MSYQYKMTQYNTLYVKLANSQFHKLKSEIKKDALIFYWILSVVKRQSFYLNCY